METFGIRNSLRSTIARAGWIAAAVAAATFGWAGTSNAAGTCVQDAFGGTTNCTANDFAVSSVTVTNVIKNDCGGATNSFTFDGTLNVANGNASRYDMGFYISTDSNQAVTGNCSVSIIPAPNGTVDDGDTCGDYDGNAVNVPVSNITVKCNDGDGNGFFDLALCSAWDQNASNSDCFGPADAIPGTKSKCDCTTVNTDVQVPHCANASECPDDNNVCTTAVCLPVGQPGDDGFGCTTQNNTNSCDDGQFCNGTDVCSGGTCGHSGDPCAGGGVCGNVCNEATDSCFVAQGTVCRPSTGVCDPEEVCTGSSGACPANAFLSSVCRPSTGECDPAESCSGSTGNCPADAFSPPSTPCTSDGNPCTDDFCDGAGSCQNTNNSNPCDDGLFCTVNDVCSGGTCSGAARDCADAIDCTADSCNEATNSCENTPVNSNCNDQDSCTTDICSAISGCINTETCGAVICRSPGYWATHSGYEKDNSINVGQLVIDAAGPLEVCGQSITKTSNQSSPFLDGLGLTSDLEGLCMRTKGVHQRQLYRQLVAAALNCGISGGDCDAIIEPLVGVTFSACSDLCAGNPPPIAPSVGQCVAALDCFNNGGQIVNGICATGTCEIDSSIPCGGDAGDCSSGACIPFPANCHDTPLCNEALGVCPKKTPASSPAACQEARFDSCTIDSCN